VQDASQYVEAQLQLLRRNLGEKLGRRGRNFPVFPLVAIHDWTEKS